MNLALTGQTDEAKSALQKLRHLAPGMSQDWIFNAGNMPNDTHRLTAMIEFLVANPEVAKHPKIAKLLQ